MSHDPKADTREVAVDIDPRGPDFDTVWTDVPMVREPRASSALLVALFVAVASLGAGWIAWGLWPRDRYTDADRSACAAMCLRWGYSISRPADAGGCTCRPPCVAAAPGRTLTCEYEEAERIRRL